MGASYRMDVIYNGRSAAECYDRARQCIGRLGWAFRGELPGREFRAGISMSMLSYGEEVIFSFFQDRFVIESKCSFPLQFIDWGKNRKNVESFLQMYNQMP